MQAMASDVASAATHLRVAAAVCGATLHCDMEAPQAACYQHCARQLAPSLGIDPARGGHESHARNARNGARSHQRPAENGSTGRPSEASTLRAFMTLYRAAQHPLLVRWHFSDAHLDAIARALVAAAVPAAAPAQLAAMPDVRLDALCAQHATLQHLRLPPAAFTGAKVRAVLQVMADLKPRARSAAPPKVVLASIFPDMLAVLHRVLASHGMRCSCVDADTPPAAACAALGAFSDAASRVECLLVQTDAVLRSPLLQAVRPAGITGCVFVDAGFFLQARPLFGLRFTALRLLPDLASHAMLTRYNCICKQASSCGAMGMC